MDETLKHRKHRFLKLKNLHDAPPEPPDMLSERAKRLWSDLVPRRCASPEALTLLEVALRALDRLTQIQEAIKANELVAKTERSGAQHAHPLLRNEKETRAQFLAAWGQLGLEQDHRFDHRGTGEQIADELKRIRSIEKDRRERKRRNEEARRRMEAERRIRA